MLKRLFDFTAALVGLICISPILLFVALWIKFDSKGPVFYRQVRVGLNGEDFKIHKFRTMAVDSDKKGGLTIGRDSRITNSGHFLRKYKIDELAQLLDVVAGTMSLVGPRPEIPEFMNKYSDESRKKILSVRPGMTDLASIEMIDENDIIAKYDDPRQAYIDKIMPIKEKYYLDYVENNNFISDLGIIFKTIYKIIR